ncbi:ECF transporter S component [Lysinibacillus macroides]|uniref:Metal ion ABC transporter, membrane-spanning subunit n=1 Tax=Lysinibacillus macroides TaxID=33935 RepID=A0A0M9DI89_9BACI|nr:ECF transporter S component [Lysinibacillus macroides]KOY80976.1 metal ion ABC transporter, membrane-spanning subunit [Lysinibacillus macroides]QPR68880.1 ECF transporter S component [Lysinibacillus macroides]
MSKNIRLMISIIVIVVLMPLTLYAGITLFADRKYYFISIVIIILACVPFFLSFERRKPQPREILVIAVMAAISVAGRALFVITPGFKPVAAITAITGFSLGAEAGFLTGALSALVSNMFFGQGPWTPFQMFMWGMIGFIAGLLGKTGLMHKKIPLILFGIFAGVFFSFGMDIWGTISMYGVFSWQAYTLALTSAVPFMMVYAVSNVIFLLLLEKPIREKLERIKNKYGILQ